MGITDSIRLALVVWKRILNSFPVTGFGMRLGGCH